MASGLFGGCLGAPSAAVSARIFLGPIPCDLDNRAQLLEARLPAEFLLDLIGSRDQTRRVAGAARPAPNPPLSHAGFRQLLPFSFKIAAKQGQRYFDLLKANEEVVARNVTANLYERHLLPLFVG